MRRILIRTALLAVITAAATAPANATATAENSAPSAQAFDSTLDRSYRRLLPLEGGSNFRDLGGYPTEQGRMVVRGQLFRSGAMSSLTTTDQHYLQQFGFKSVMDLRSNEEIELLPNRWAEAHQLNLLRSDYSILAMMEQARAADTMQGAMGGMYRNFPNQLAPQLKLYFNALLQQQTPIVVNCSAGQDRTGFTSAVLLSALGVARQLIVEDYLLSTDFRRPALEMGQLDLAAAAQSNAFAKLVMAHRSKQADPDRPNPLLDPFNQPLIVHALASVDAQYGSVEGYLTRAIGLSQEQITRLQRLYTAPL